LPGKESKKEKGQAMMLTVLVISGTTLGATTIAGLLMLYQLRQATSVTYSSQALFAADAGLEWELFKLFNPDAAADHQAPEMTNGSTFESAIVEGENILVKSVGCAGQKNVCRAFQVILTE